MNHNRQLRGRRQFHLPRENFFLHIARGMIVEIIQPNLAPSNDLGMHCEALHVPIGGVIREPGFVRMYAESRVNELVFLGQPDSAIHLRRPVAVADGHDRLHPRLSRARNNFLPVGVEALAIKMRVRVNKHSRWSLVVGRSSGYQKPSRL